MLVSEPGGQGIRRALRFNDAPTVAARPPAAVPAARLAALAAPRRDAGRSFGGLA